MQLYYHLEQQAKYHREEMLRRAETHRQAQAVARPAESRRRRTSQTTVQERPALMTPLDTPIPLKR